MKLPQIKIYIGKVSQWTEFYKGEDRLETVCGKFLLLYGLLQKKEECKIFMADTPQKAYFKLKEQLQYGSYGKPKLLNVSEIHFNISHSGKYAVCAISKVPCGIDIQEKKELKNQRIFDKTLSEAEQKEIFAKEDKTDAFYGYWTRKESYLKLTGQGLTVDLRELPTPTWYEDFILQKDYKGCISADTECKTSYEYISPSCFLKCFDK